MTNKNLVLVDTENLNEFYTYEENLPIIELIDKLATALVKRDNSKDGSEYFEKLAKVCHINTDSMNPNLLDDTHDDDIKDLLETAEAAKAFIKQGDYEKALDNLNHIKYLTQWI